MTSRRKPSKSFCAAQFDQYIEVQEPSKVSDLSGGFVKSWVNKFYIYCEQSDSGGNEFFEHDQLETQTTTKFKTWHREDIDTTTDRLIDETGKEYNIRHIEDVDSRHQFIIIHTDGMVLD